MPIVDMPLEQLRTYQGCNPCPDDFDAFWDKSLSEMQSTNPKVELLPYRISASFAECFHLYFTGVAGARIYAKYLRPKKAATPHPAVLVFHGYGGSSGDWTQYLPYAAQGFSVAALDSRGQAGLSQDIGGVTGTTFKGQIIRGLDDGPEKLLFRLVFLDCAQLARIVMEMPEVDEKRVGVHGGSQGGGLTLAAAALEPRIKLAAPIFPFLCDYLRIWQMDLAVAAYEEIRTYLRQYDPLHERETEIFTTLGYIDVQYLAKRIRAQVRMFTGLMDTICPPSTQFAAYNKIKSPKDMVIYPDFGHEGLPEVSDRTFEFMAGL